MEKKPSKPKTDPAADAPAETPSIEITTSRQALSWMAEQKLSLAVTTYQVGKVLLLGVGPEGRLSVFERTLDRCMGMAASGDSLYISTLWQLWRFENTLAPGQSANGYDRVYTPQVGFVTGDLDIHDLGIDGAGRLVFVNTLFSCLARTSETHSFEPIWKPPFISKLAAEDRCHMNGLAMRDGAPAFVTGVAESDSADGWREHRRDGGFVMDVASGETVAGGLSMPHSPRWHDGKLWLLNAGTGEFGHVDLEAGRFEPLCFCPGFLRGLSFIGDYAVVGLSLPRDNRTFTGLALQETLEAKKAEPRCAIHVIDLRSGDTVHWIRFEGVFAELYDVVCLPDAQRPSMIGFKTDEVRRVLSIADTSTGSSPGLGSDDLPATFAEQVAKLANRARTQY